ncbi:MAG TPA: IS3 family transposase [Blastocatellia bacterium]|nr:IS3 family transposase [Blastocatellia bacterium]
MLVSASLARLYFALRPLRRQQTLYLAAVEDYNPRACASPDLQGAAITLNHPIFCPNNGGHLIPGRYSGCISRKVIGWALGRTLEASLAVEALKMAIRAGRVQEGLVHHSDRGVQYTSREYTGLLKAHEIEISMSRRGNPYDNAKAESFMKTLKYEEVYRAEYVDFADARRQVGRFIQSVYNQQRLHSALGYLPPAEFEAEHLASIGSGAVAKA